MAEFDEKKQEKKVEELHQSEEEDLARILSEKYGLGYIDLSRTAINNEALRLIDEKEARDALLVPFNRKGKNISLAVKSPNKDETRATIQKLEDRGYTVSSYMVSMRGLERAWGHYQDLSFAAETRAGELDISGSEIQKATVGLHTLTDVGEKVEEILKTKKPHLISRVLEIIIAGALSSKASDIHIEPEESYVRLRFRLDGVLIDVVRFDQQIYNLLASRIKLISGLKLNIKDEAQDGRFSIHIDQKDVEVRASVLPGTYGESVVLRLLDPTSLAPSMEKLGIEPYLLSIFEKEIHKPNGMILNTGPTGSGKTTALYSFLSRIHSADIKIITIEDPVEYHLPGIVQTQTSENYTFAEGLRSALRQDPDVIMIGEIRDSEVAETAVNSALTGHAVFSTLHTNTAAGAIPRLIDLGVNPSVIGSSINIIIAQRLVRVLKPECKREVKLSGKDKEVVEKVLSSIVNTSLIPKNTDTVFEPIEAEGDNKECAIPYNGRIGIFEAILVDEKIGTLAEASASEYEIAEGAKEQGILTMEQDGILKVLRGTTSLSELRRVLDLDGIPKGNK